MGGGRGFSRGGGIRIGGGGGYRIGGIGGSRGYSYYGNFSSYGRRYRSFGYGPSWYRYPAGRFPYLARSYRSYGYYPYFYTSFALSPYYYNDWYWTPNVYSYYTYPASTSYYTYTNSAPATYVAPRPAYVPPAAGGRDQFGQRQESVSGEPVTYLIATRGGSVESCVAYWVEGRTLHYVTRDHAMHETPLESVDREYSEQLNRERQVTFRLPR